MRVSVSLMLMLSWPMLATAHHSHASLSRDHNVTLIGMVTEYRWQSPHVYIKANAVNEAGEVVEYTIETLNPPSLMRAGWTEDTFKPGDAITWHGPHDKDPDRAYTGINWAIRPDGTYMYTSATAQRKYLQEAGREIPEILLDSQQAVPAERVGQGTWTRIGPDGGRFPAVRRPPEDWPLTEQGEAHVENFSEDENPLNECIFQGPPRNILNPMRYQFSRPEPDTILLDRDLWPQARVIHLDRDHPVGEPSTWGHSVGWFEDEVLVIETTNFLAEKWGTHTGIDSSDQKHLMERYWLSEGGMRLNVEITVEDPPYLAEPVTYTHQWAKLVDTPLAKAPCSMEAAWFYVTAGYEGREPPKQ